MKLNKILSSKYERPQAIPTGIASLDRMIGGLQVGHVVTVGARPAMGKTAFVMSLVRNIGIINKVPTALLSLEHDEHNVASRLWTAEFGWSRTRRPSEQIAMESNICKEQENAIRMLQNIGFDNPIQKKEDYARMMNEAPVWVEHAFVMTMDEVISRMERLKKENNVSVVVIDSLDLIISGAKNAEQEQAMMNLVQAAWRLKVAVLLTTNLNREVEYRVSHIPSLSNLRGGYSTDTLTSVVMFLYRPEYYGIEEDECGNTEGKVQIFIAKNDFGETGLVRLNFVGRSRIEDIECCIPEMPSRMNETDNESLF